MYLTDALLQGVGTEVIPTSAAILVVFGLLYLLYEWLLPQPYPGIPYDPKSARSILGDAPDLVRELSRSKEAHVWLMKKATELQEPLCQIFVQPFCRPWIILADPVEAQNVMTRRPEFERAEIDRISLSSLDGFHSTHYMGEGWKRTRNWLQDLVSPGFLNNRVSPLMYESSRLLVQYWTKKSQLANDRPFDGVDDVDQFAIDSVMSFVFDDDYKHAALIPRNEAVGRMNSSDIKVGRSGEAIFPQIPLNKFVAAMYGTVDIIGAVTETYWPILGQYYIRWKPRFARAISSRRKIVEEQVQAAIKRFEATGEPKTAIEHMLMREKKAAEKQGRKPDYTNKVLRDEIGGQFLAGFHTSASTLTWMFIHLTRAPEIQVKLRDAIHTAYATAYAERRAPSQEELAKTRVPWVDAVVDEVLRLHATVMTRDALRDTEIFGRRIPKGTTIYMLCNGAGYHSPSFDESIAQRGPTNKTEFAKEWDESRDMFTFEPERWLRAKERKTDLTTTEDEETLEFNANAAPMHAFGLGIRGCWGRKLAYLKLRMLLTMVIWHFDLLPVPHALNNASATWSVIHRSDACYVRLRRRQDSGNL